MLRDQHAAGSEQALAGIGDRRDMVHTEGEDAAHVGYDHVHRSRQRNAGRKVLEELDPVCAAVAGGHGAGHLNGVVRLDRVHLARAELAGQHREDAGPGSDVRDDRSRFDRPAQRLGIGIEAHAIRDHLAVAVYAIHCGPKSRTYRRPRW